MEEQFQILIDENKRQLKGNLHTHTNRVDGVYSPQQVVQLYEDRNYDFLAITEHDFYDEKVDQTEHSSDMLLIPGMEATCTYCGEDDTVGEYCHFLCLGRKPGQEGAYHPGTFQNAEDLQRYIGFLNEQFQIVQFNHPLFSKLPDSDWLRLSGYRLLEVYNHKDFYTETGEENAGWLARTLMNHGIPFFVTASDDFHGSRDHKTIEECFAGFLMVQAEKNVESVLQAVQMGKFYASTGPLIFYYALEGQCLRIRTSAAHRISFYSNLRRCRHIYHNDGTPVQEAEYLLTGDERYIWTKVVDDERNIAWTQPIFLNNAAGNPV